MKRQPQLLMGLWLTGVVVAAQPALGSENSLKTSPLFEQVSTSGNVKQLLSQASTLTSPIVVNGVRVDTIHTGIEVIIETKQSPELQVASSISGNSLIADITNAQLRLTSENTFRQKQPVAGIAEVLVINQDNNTIRVTIIGETKTPTYTLLDSDEGLIFSITTATSSTSQLETPQQPSKDNPTRETTAKPTTETDAPIELLVTGEQNSYRVTEESTATKLDVPMGDVPASVQVIPKQVIQDRQVVRLNELADNISGVRPQGTLGGLASQGYFIRGFATGFEALRDGFKDFGFTSPRDVANIEKVEFLKGPASVLYGSASNPGGVVNTITKKPLPDPFYQISGTIGSYDFYRGTIDFTGPLTENRAALYRLNVAYENANSFRDFVDNESTFINPVVNVKVAENTNVTFAYEYQKYNYGFDRGFTSDSTVIFDLPITRSLDEPNLQDAEYRSNNFAYNLESKFGYNNKWKFRQAFNILKVSGASQGVQSRGITADGQTVRRRFRRSESDTTNFAFQNEITGKFNTGLIHHNLLLGLELFSYQFKSNFFQGNIAELNIFNPVYGAQPENIRRTYIGEYGAENIAVYLQNLIELTPNLKFLAGGRFDWVDSYDIYEDEPDLNTRNSDAEFSPRLGIVYQPTDTTSIYASWTNSFNPQYFGRSRNNEPFKPETSEQFEIGIKQDFLNNQLSTTLAFFDISKKNVLTPDPIDTDFSVQTGEQKSRGVELDIVGEILPGWKVIATYAYTHAYVSEDNSPELINDRLPGVPYHSASLWTTYELQQGNLQGLGLGLGLVYAGERAGSLPNQIQIPSYVRTDASIFYQRNNWRAAVNFKNLFDTKYYESQTFFIVPAAPLTVLGNISFDF